MRLKIWMNAFIPRTVLGYTRLIATGTHAGKTAVPLPAVGLLNPVNFFNDMLNAFDTGYLTDQRDFNQLPGASSRMQSLVEIELTPLSFISQNHKSSGTTEVDLKTGDQLGFEVANMSRCRFTVTPMAPMALQRPSPGGAAFSLNAPSSPVFNVLKLRLDAAAGDPLVSASADIDYQGDFMISRDPSGNVTVRFDGKIDAFPAYECYASMNGVTKTLFTAAPPPGNTVANLLGSAERGISGQAVFP